MWKIANIQNIYFNFKTIDMQKKIQFLSYQKKDNRRKVIL